MALKARYLVELVERPCDIDSARAVRERLTSDAALNETTKKRARYEKDDRWWSVLAGVLIVAMSVLYSFNLKTVANVAAVVLCVYVVAIFAYILTKRYLLKHTDSVISPTRALDSLFRKALNLPPHKNDVSRFYDAGAISALSQELASRLIPLAREAGVEPETWEVAIDTNPRLAESDSRDVIALPVLITLTATASSGASAEFLLEYFASFVASDGGDLIACDAAPRVLDVIAREPRLHEDMFSVVGWEKCTGCGVRTSSRYLKAVDGACPACKGRGRE